MTPMQRAILTLTNAVGLHARPAAQLVQTASRFQSSISVRNVTLDTPVANAKSILAVLALGAERNHVIEISVEGPDEVEALGTLRRLVETRFGEE